MNFNHFFSNIPGNDLERNIYSPDRLELLEKYIEQYQFLKKDQIYVDFLRSINGVGIFNHPFIIIIYGFSLEEGNLHLSLSNYEEETGYLAIAEFVEKKKKEWKSIGYYYKKGDEESIIYARFFSGDKKTISKLYFPLCTGFEFFINILSKKNYDEQFELVTKKNK